MPTNLDTFRLYLTAIVLLQGNVYCTSTVHYRHPFNAGYYSILFGQHYEIEALISEFEVSPSVWNVLTLEYRDRVQKKHC